MKNVIKTSVLPIFLSLLMLVAGIFCFILPKQTVLAEDTGVVAEEGTIEVGEGSCILDFYLVNDKIPAFRARYKTEKEVEEGGNQKVTTQIAGADEYGRYKDAVDENSSTSMSTVLSNFTIGINTLSYLSTAPRILGYITYPVNGYGVGEAIYCFFEELVCTDWWDNGGTLSLYARWNTYNSGNMFNFTLSKLNGDSITVQNQSVFTKQSFLSNGDTYEGYLPTCTIAKLYDCTYTGQYWQIIEVNGEKVCGNIYDSMDYIGDALLNVGAPAGANIVLEQVDVTEYTFKMYEDETTVYAERTRSVYGSPLPTIATITYSHTPSKDYYYFAGWDYTGEDGKVYTFQKTDTIASLVKVLSDADKTSRTINLYAHWEGYEYSVTFDGANPQYLDYSSDATIKSITDVSGYGNLSGYQFMGWTTNKNFEGAYSNINYTYNSESDVINITSKASISDLDVFETVSFTYADGVLTNTSDSSTATLIKDGILLSDLVTLAKVSTKGANIELYSVWFDTWANHTEEPTVTDQGGGTGIEKSSASSGSAERHVGNYFIIIQNEAQLAWLADWINNPQDVTLNTSRANSPKLKIYNEDGRMYWGDKDGDGNWIEGTKTEIMVYIYPQTYNLSNYLWIPMGTKTNPCRMRLCYGMASGLMYAQLKDVDVENMTILNPVGNARDYSGFWGELGIGSTGYDYNGTDWLKKYYISMDITNSYVEGGNYTGALAGYSISTSQKFSKCNVLNSSIKGRYCTGGMIGDLRGVSVDSLKITYSKVTGDDHTGGLVGFLGVSSCHSSLSADNITVTGENFVGGLCGILMNATTESDENYSISNSTIIGVLDIDNDDYGKYVGGVAGFRRSFNKVVADVENVTVKGNIAGGVFGGIGDDCLSDNTITSAEYSLGCKLTISDIEIIGDDYAGGAIGHVAGSPFSTDSSTKLLSGWVDGGTAGGFVGYFDASEVSTESYISGVKNLDVEVYGNSCAGGIVGYIAISNSNMNIKYCQNYAYTHASHEGAGGIVGCIDANSLTTNKVYFYHCCNYQEVSGYKGVGGIVGLITGSSSISQLSFEICYNYGDILDGVSVGGILGKISVNDANCTFSCCYNSGTIQSNDWNGNLRLGGIVGYIANSGNSNVEIKNTVSRGSVEVYYGTISYSYEYNLGSLIGDIEKSTSYYYCIHDCYVASRLELLGTIDSSDKVNTNIYSVLRIARKVFYYLRGNDATTSPSNINKDFSNWTYIQGWETPLPAALVGLYTQDAGVGSGIIGGTKYDINEIIKYGTYTSGGSWTYTPPS